MLFVVCDVDLYYRYYVAIRTSTNHLSSESFVLLSQHTTQSTTMRCVGASDAKNDTRSLLIHELYSLAS